MEFEFDKEIDALLRKARENEAVFTANISEPHLDADALNAFAENALPEKSKKLYTAHLAECDRCRRILSNLISINGEEEIVPVKIAETPTIETAIPWYRKLFFGRNPVYAMGALVAVFGAFMAYIVLQNSSNSLSSEVSQANTSKIAARGPNAGEEIPLSNTATAANTSSTTANAAISTNTSANVAMPSMNSASVANTAAAQPSKPETAAKENILDDGDISGGETLPYAAAPQNSPTRAEESRDAKNESAEAKPEPMIAKPKDDRSDAPKTTAAIPAPPPPPPAEDEKDEKKVALATRKLPNQPSARSAGSVADKESANKKRAGGKTFRYENSVWIDSEYRQGSPITNVSRGTNEYKKLDGGLRNIAEQFRETVIVVWKSKTYRIQ